MADEIKTTLDSALAAAVEKLDAKEKPEPEETPAEETTETIDPDDLSDEETKAAANLFRLLKNPETQVNVIEMLAKQAGVLKMEIKTEKQADAAADKVLSIFEEELGEDYKFLAPRLEKAVEKFFDKRFEERTKDIRADNEASKAERLANEAETAILNLFKEIPDATNYQTEMTALMDKMKPAAGVSRGEYLRNLYRIASSEKSTRATKNANDLGSRVATGAKAGEPAKESSATKSTPMSLQDSIAAAMAQLEKKG